MRARQLELKQTLLVIDVPTVIETVVRTALDDTHKNPAAQKILMDRILPISTFDKQNHQQHKCKCNRSPAKNWRVRLSNNEKSSTSKKCAQFCCHHFSVLVAFELNQNQQSLLESNNLARIQAANNERQHWVRQQQLENIEIWVKGSKMESLDETEEAVFRILCGSYIFNLGNLYEADFYSGNMKKLTLAYIIEPLGSISLQQGLSRT